MTIRNYRDGRDPERELLADERDEPLPE